MLSPGDRLIFDNGGFSFQTAHGTKIEMNQRISWSRPTAQIDLIAIHCFMDYLRPLVNCALDLHPTPTGFILTFRTPLSIAKPSTPFHLRLKDVELRQETLGLSPSNNIVEVVNREGSLGIQWCLEALFGVSFAIQILLPSQISWTPPKAKAYSGPPIRRTSKEEVPTAPLTQRSGRK